jgi:hypothetical protein
MPEMLTPTSAVMGAGLGKDVALIYRWPIFGWIARIYRGTHHAGGAGGRPDCADPQRRFESRSMRRRMC